MVSQVFDAATAGPVADVGFLLTIVHGKLFKVGKDRDRKFGAPCVAAHLVGRQYFILHIHTWLLGFHKK